MVAGLDDVTEILGAECDSFCAVALGLSEQQFGLPTRCPPWDVKDLVAHVWRSMFRIPTALDEPRLDEPPDTDAVTYWRSYDPADDSPMIAEHARETAENHPSGSALARELDRLCRECVSRAAAEDPARVIRTWWGPRLRLDEFLATRVLEVLVHGIDLTAAVGMRPVATEPGTRLVVDVLKRLVGSELPEDLGWSDVELIDKACGRAPLDERERALLGPAAGAFPVLG